MAVKKFEMEIDVKPSDIDQLGHVNNIVYLHWVQDVATAHWYAEADENEKKNILWVVIRHEIDYKRSAFLGDKIIARTWVGKASKRDFERFTELSRKSDNKILATARTLWCPINAESKRPTRVSDEVYRKFSTNITDN